MPARTFSTREPAGEQPVLAGGGVLASGLAVALAAVETGWLAALGILVYRLVAHGSV